MADGMRFAGRLFDGSGSVVSGATINLYDVGTVTPVRATTTTDATGDWEINHATRGLFDVELVSGTTTRRLVQDTEFQVKSVWVWNADADEYALGITRTENVASVEVAYFEGDRSSPAANDEGYIVFRLSDSAGNQDNFAALRWVGTTVTSASEAGRLDFGVIVSGTLSYEVRLDGTSFAPVANDGNALGTTSLGWGDLHLATGGVINWANGEVTITETDANTLTVAGGTLAVDTLTFPGTESTTGEIRFAQNQAIKGRNNADSADVALFGWGTVVANVLTLGQLTYFTHLPGIVGIGDTANANMTLGLTINQGANDNEILALKSSDVGTGLTTGTLLQDVETDDFLTLTKIDAGTGGLGIQVLDESTDGDVLYVDTYGGAPETSDTSGSLAAVNFFVAQHNGSNSLSDMAANSNAFVWGEIDSGSLRLARMLLKADDGELHLGNSTLVALDAEDDVQLVRAMQRAGASEGIIETEYDNPFYDYERLHSLGLAGKKDASGFFLFPLQTRLHAHEGAIWQVWVRQQRQVAALRAEIAELRQMLAA
jgi:hypothetical protein